MPPVSGDDDMERGPLVGEVLLNKIALSQFRFRSANALLLFQCGLAAALVQACAALGVVQLEPFSLRVARVWFPVNIIFVGMIGTSFWALQALNVAMVTVLKNLSNLFTIGGDYYFYGRTYSLGVWACMGLMVLSAVCGGATDLTFNLWGYIWQVVNCGFAAGYSLYLRGVMDRVAAVTSNGKKLDELSMVYYNNLLSVPLILGMLVVRGELGGVWSEPDLTNPRFQLVATLSGLIGFGISFTSLWFLSTTTPTTYSLVGSLNKVPTAIIGLLAFSAPWTLQASTLCTTGVVVNLASIMVGLVAGVVFVVAKSRN
ncbi:hypothetical protein N2152v2_007082 [Parachlorella kessleri]